ncbi:MAG TPA: family 16 glycoside hydrolase [Pirellulales bacterium]|nr:family 16 glycoside hydrolase [Pirellulales bacterium]
MKLSVDQFTHDLEAYGLLTAADLQAFRADATHGAQADANELARKLVAAGKLTKYQSTNALQGKAKNLVFGEYVVLAKIGSGGMGDVFKAEHRRMKRVVALKILPPAAVKSPEAVQRFQQEMQAAARLEHANIVTAHDAGEGHGVHFLVMQYVDGRDLASLVAERGPLPVSNAVNYIVQAARGLAYAHGKGIVHRDVKPANLLLNGEGTVKILDMGIAQLDRGTASAMAGNRASLTAAGEIMGTVDYMAPEQAEDPRQADARSDIYSLGCTLYFLLTGEPLYQGATVIKKMVAHREQPIPSLTVKRPDIPPGLDRVFARMVAKQAAERFQTMQEVIAALESLKSTEPGTVNSAWAAPVHAPTEGSTGLTTAGPGETVAGGGSATLLENNVVKKTWIMTAKIVGAMFGTVIAPILVAFILKYLDKPDAPAQPATSVADSGATSRPVPAATTPEPAAKAPAVATTAPVATATAPDVGTTSSKPALQLVPGKPADILAAIDVRRDRVQGDSELQRGVLRLRGPGNRHFTILRLPVEQPPEYDLMLVASRPKDGSGEGPLIAVFPLDGQRGAIVMDGFRKGGERFWALQEVDGKAPLGNGTAVTDKPPLTASPSRIMVKVRHGYVAVSSNDKPVFTWRGEAQQLSLPKGWTSVPTTPCLCLLSVADFHISQIAFVPGGGDWTELFNGFDLNGWKGSGLNQWKIDAKNGVLSGTSAKQGEWLQSEREYGDLRLRLEFSMKAGTNSGVAVRVGSNDKSSDYLQIELRSDADKSADLATGALRNAGTAKRRNLSPAASPTLKSAGKWNEFELELVGNRLRAWINGTQVQNADLGRAAGASRAAPALKRRRGHIALQAAAGEIRFRNIALHEIDPE